MYAPLREFLTINASFTIMRSCRPKRKEPFFGIAPFHPIFPILLMSANLLLSVQLVVSMNPWCRPHIWWTSVQTGCRTSWSSPRLSPASRCFQRLNIFLYDNKVFRIRLILIRIRILGSVSDYYGSGSEVILTLWILFSLWNVLQCFHINYFYYNPKCNKK